MDMSARASVAFALQTWLAETPEQKRTASSPGYFGVGMACMFLPILALNCPLKSRDIELMAFDL